MALKLCREPLSQQSIDIKNFSFYPIDSDAGSSATPYRSGEGRLP
jgi:hypothetical protein